MSFRLENEVFGEIEAEADREVEAITGTDGGSPGLDNEVRYSFVFVCMFVFRAVFF